MKAYFTIIISVFFLLLTVSVQSQSPYPQTSAFTYVYKLTDTEAQYFVKHKDKQIEFKSEYLHTLVDSFKTDKPRDTELASGNYLFLSAHENKLVYEMRNVSTLQILVQKQYKKVALIVTDSTGNAITTARVKVNNRWLKFDKKLQAYILNASPDKARVEVITEHENAFFELIKNTETKDYSDEGTSSVILTGTVKYVVQPTIFILSLPFDLVKSLYYWNISGSAYWLFKPFTDIYYLLSDDIAAPWIGYCFSHNKVEQEFNKGYIVFNKPKYKQGDTVMFKAFITDKNGTALQREAIVKLWGNKAIELIKLKPYRAGAYMYQFVLSDSLDLKLDRDYTVGLFDTKYNSLISGRFHYEAYELKSASFSMKAEKEEHYRHVPAVITCSGTDENGLNLLGASVELTVTTVSLSNPQSKFVCLGDTLWTHKQMLNPDRKTQIEIPDSIFPDADVMYNVNAVFYTSDYEKHYSFCTLNFTPSSKKVECKIKHDSIYFTYIHNGIAIPKKNVKLTPIDADYNEFVSTTLNLPAAIKLNPLVAEYEFEADSLDFTVDMLEKESGLSILSNKTEDSLFVNVANPTNIAFNYFLYKEKKLIKSGNNTELPLAIAISGNKMFHIVLSYNWAGKANSMQQAIAFKDKTLNITLSHPDVCFPGQKIKITARVTDANNKPVENADLTVYANTAKFNDHLPDLPYWGKPFFGKDIILNDYSETEKIETVKKSNALDYIHWNPRFRLSQVEYYQLTHPEGKLFQHIESTKDSGAWITPYLVRNGKVLPVEIVYLNSIPIWFAQAASCRPYCLPIIAGEGNKITIRSTNCEVSFFVDAKSGTATVVSAEADKTNKSIDYKECKPKYSAYEMQLLNRYLIRLINVNDVNPSYAWQGDNIFLTSNFNVNQNSRTRDFLVGPLYNGKFGFNAIGEYKMATDMEQGYSYSFAPNKVKQISQERISDSYLYAYTPSVIFSPRPLTMDSIKQSWEQYANNVQRNIEANTIRSNQYNYSGYKTDECNLSVTINKKKITQPIKNILLINIETSKLVDYNGNKAFFSALTSGYYQLVFLFDNNKYILTDTLLLTRRSKAALTIDSTFCIHNADTFSLYHNQRIRNLLKLRFTPKPIPIENVDSLTQHAFTFTNTITNGVMGKIMGKVIDLNDGTALPGVTIVVKSASKGTVTNYDGYFELAVNDNSVEIIVSYLGYKPQTLRVKNGKKYTISLESDELNLDEVVVVGYGVQKKSFLSVKVRGVSTINSGDFNAPTNAPTVVDSVVMLEESFSNFDMDSNILSPPPPPADDNVNKDSKSNKKLDKMLNNATLIDELNKQHNARNRFADYAFWQPCLLTNNKGIASFTITLPDDITQWNVFALAATDNKQNGGAQSAISTFKPVSAVLPVPRFLVLGDNVTIKGKVQNYKGDTLTVHTQFTLNNAKQAEQQKLIRFSALDSLQLKVEKEDTLKLAYSLQLANGYTDEEVKRIPVIKAGTQETIGQFWAIKRDTTFTYQQAVKSDSLIVHAECDMLNIVLDETNSIYHYKYLCNEQLASKLKALLFEKAVSDKIKRAFKHKKDIEDIIQKLQKNQNTDQLWSWWGNSPYSVYWISLHAIESLLMAQEAGFAIKGNNDALQNNLYALMRTPTVSVENKLRIAQIIRKTNTNTAFIDVVSKIKINAKANFSTQMEYQYVRSLAMMAVNLDSLYALHHTSLMGNIYWGSADLSYTNSVVSEDLWASLLMYKMLQTKGGNKEKCDRIRDWFLEKRRDGGWLNTFASSSILETLLPDILNENLLNNPSALSLTVNGVTADVCRYPYHKSFKNTDKIAIATKGKAPIYLSAYSKVFNPNPERIDKDFQIETSFISTTAHKAVGNSIRLHVKVNVKRSTDYVMIEVPIPSGCSYESKPQFSFVDHCEYFDEKVSLFSSHLNQGVYEFDVPLLARFSGNFIINPAKAEHMYFPVLNGHTGMSMLEVK